MMNEHLCFKIVEESEDRLKDRMHDVEPDAADCELILKPCGTGADAGVLYSDAQLQISAAAPTHPSLQPAAATDKDEVARLQAELREAQHRIDKLEESRRHLISNLSHELRTPITLIQGYVEGFLEGVIVDKKRQRRALETIYSKVTGMDRLISNMFQLTALESQQGNKELQPVPVVSLQETLRTKFELDVEHAGHKLLISVGNVFYEKALYVNVDLDRLDQVFANLLSNAIRHLPKKDGLIHIDLEYWDRESKPKLLVRIKDNGDGIEEKDLPFIFDRFYSSDSSRNPKRKSGIGLGLAICREIVAAHGGAISAISKPGEGAEFLFTIPIGE